MIKKGRKNLIVFLTVGLFMFICSISLLANSFADSFDEEIPDAGASAGKYANAIGVCSGKYYANTVDGKNIIYELIKTYGTFDASKKFKNKSEVIKYAAQQGLALEKDYDYIHLYNYNDPTDTDRGLAPNGKAYYVAYLYKKYTGGLEGLKVNLGKLKDAKTEDQYRGVLNTSGVFAQNKSSITLKNFTTNSYSIYYGATEGRNFYGSNSNVLADSGATITLVNPTIFGLANSVYATYSGVVNITGGNIFSCYTGGHGPYVGYSGRIYINTTEGAPEPAVTNRPKPDLAYIERNKKTRKIKVYDKTGEKITAIITGDEAGTTLTTDTGGGTVVANRVLTKSYGSGSAGVYSIGTGEGFVYVYNSTLISYNMEGLCSASGGYIYVNNCDIQGVSGIKTRAGGQNSKDMSEVRVKNSRVTAYYDKDEVKRIYDVASSEDIANSNIINKKQQDWLELNILVNKRSGFKGFDDGTSEGNSATMGKDNMALINTDGSGTPIYLESTRLVNRNYIIRSKEKDSKENNQIISVDGNGTASVFFINNNSKTKWDLTGESDETTELVGDFNIAEASESSEMGMMMGRGGGESMPDSQEGMQDGRGEMPGGMSMPEGMDMSAMSQKGNYLNASFENSEWKGTVVGDSENANLTFDARSSWDVTGETIIGTLNVVTGTVIKADKPTTLTCSKLIVKDKGNFIPGKNVTIKVVKAEEAKDTK